MKFENVKDILPKVFSRIEEKKGILLFHHQTTHRDKQTPCD